MTETTKNLSMVQSKNFRPFSYFRGTLIDGENVYHSPTERTETTEILSMMQRKDFRPFCYFRETFKDGKSVYHSPTEMTETTERLRMAQSKNFRPFSYFRGTLIDGKSDTIVPQKGQKQQKFSEWCKAKISVLSVISVGHLKMVKAIP